MTTLERSDVLRIPTATQLRQEMQRAGLIESRKIHGHDVYVGDIGRIQHWLSSRFGEGAARSKEKTERLMRSLTEAFPEPVVAKADLDAGAERIVAAPLFYVPASASDATSTVAIKGAKFHLRFTDVLKKLRLRAAHPTADSSRISTLESQVALLIFHPKYGDGYRDEGGVLRVRDKRTREFVAFSGSFLEEWGISKNYFLFPEGTRIHRPDKNDGRSLRDGLSAELPGLVGKGLLRPSEDVKQITLGGVHIERRAKERAGVSPSGSRMFNGVLHYIGKGPEFQGKSKQVVVVAPSLGCVVDRAFSPARVTHLFRVFTRKEVARKDGGYLAGAAMTRTMPFSAESIGIEKFSDESPARFQERLEAVDRGIAYLVLSILPRCPAAAELFLKGASQLAEIGRAAYWISKQSTHGELERFVDTFGATGLRTLLACAIDENVGQEIVDLSKHATPEQVSAVFDAFSEFADVVDTISQYAREHLGVSGPDDASRLSYSFLKKGRELLGRAHKYRDQPEKLAGLIQRYSAEGQLLLSAYQLLKDGGKIKTITDLSAVRKLEDFDPDENRQRVLEQCAALYRQNGAAEGVVNDFLKKLEKPGAVLHRVMFKNVLIAFILVTPADGEPNKVEMSALNARDELSGTNVGMNLFTEALTEQLSSGRTVVFDAAPARFGDYEKVLPRRMPFPICVMKVGEFHDTRETKEKEQLTFRGEITRVDSAQ